jgi:hypothetical protein
MAKTKTISRDVYLKALGLFHMAKMHATRADEFAAELEEILGVPAKDRRGSHFNDEVFSDGPGDLDDALRRADYVVEESA